MDIVNIDALKAQGRILNAADVDPNEDYFVLGKYTNKYTTDSFKYTKYPVWAIKAGDVMGVQSVTGLDTDNTDPLNPVVNIAVDGVTIIGEGTPASPLVAVPQTKYKVYTALLTQSGEDNLINFGSDAPLPFVIGGTYVIAQNDDNGDFTNIGAPNNNVGTYFVATGTTPASWGSNPSDGGVNVNYNTGAPVVIVLENTIGNIWFTYNNAGIYKVNSSGLFTENKTIVFLGSVGDSDLSAGYTSRVFIIDNTNIGISSLVETGPSLDNVMFNTPIEIRVYN